MTESNLHTTPLPAIPITTTLFYSQFLTPKTLGVVAATTGGFKTGFLCNLAAVALQTGKRVAFICLDMPWADIQRRLFTILCNTPEAVTERFIGGKCGHEGLPENIRDEAHALMTEKLLCIDHTATSPGTPTNLLFNLQGIADKVDLIIVDGLDSVSHEAGKFDDIESVTNLLAMITAKYPVAVWTTSQVRREAADKEVVGLTDVAFNFAKAERAPVVVTLGQCVSDKLWTACVPKDRHRQASGTRGVYRLVLLPSLRFELFGYDSLSVTKRHATVWNGDMNFIGDEIDLPDTDQPNKHDETPMAQQPNVHPYHGLNGHVPIPRQIFVSAVVQNKRYEWFYWLADLYQMAQLGDSRLMGPGTSIPVQLHRGQTMISLPMLARRWACSEKRVRTFLDHIENEGIVRARNIMPNGSLAPLTGTSKGTSIVGHPKFLGQVIFLSNYPEKRLDGHSAVGRRRHEKGHDDGRDEGT